jgi:hypothetical protein
VANKQQTTALFLSAIVTHKKTHRTDKKNWQTWWETCAVPENIQFSTSCSFLYSQTAQFNLECIGPFRGTKVIFCAVLVLLRCVSCRTPAQRSILHNSVLRVMLLIVPLYRRF